MPLSKLTMNPIELSPADLVFSFIMCRKYSLFLVILLTGMDELKLNSSSYMASNLIIEALTGPKLAKSGMPNKGAAYIMPATRSAISGLKPR